MRFRLVLLSPLRPVNMVRLVIINWLGMMIRGFVMRVWLLEMWLMVFFLVGFFVMLARRLRLILAAVRFRRVFFGLPRLLRL